MRSIIDEIAFAEQQADEIRASATADAREQVLKANEAAVHAQERQAEEAHEQLRAALERAAVDGEELAQRLGGDFTAEADSLCCVAESRVGTAIDYLLKKVQEIA